MWHIVTSNQCFLNIECSAQCIRYLVENADLDVNQTDLEGLTPLALAVKSGHRRCIDYLKIATSKVCVVLYSLGKLVMKLKFTDSCINN